MSTDSKETQPRSTGAKSHQDATEAQQDAASGVRPAHGTTGEGAGSAMARLISQEQARIIPGAPEDAPNGSS